MRGVDGIFRICIAKKEIPLISIEQHTAIVHIWIFFEPIYRTKDIDIRIFMVYTLS